MYTTNRIGSRSNTVKQPERNRYFYGMLLDAFHFKRETDYLNEKRYLLNRLVSGYGVVCGLDVTPGHEANQIWVTPGFAIDKLGHEILVTQEVGPLTIPPDVLEQATREDVPEYYMQQYQEPHPQEEVGCVRVLLCYQECETDPAPALAGDCDSNEPCMPSTIREQFQIRFEIGCDEPHEHECDLDDIITNGRLNRDEIARWVIERECLTPPDDPCIPLAHIMIEREKGHRCNPDYIDTYIRPICYSNDLLFEILLGLISERQRERRK
jgi:hypothetical protein